MTNDELKNRLAANSDPKYRDFSAALLPGVKNIYGVRLPKLREFSRRIIRSGWQDFLHQAQDDSFEEIMLQGLVTAAAPEPDGDKQKRLEKFIPKINNWSVCDSVCASLKSAAKNRRFWWNWLAPAVKSQEEFTARFAIVMMCLHFMTGDYIDLVLQKLDRSSFPGHYAKMAAGWAIAEAFIKFPEQTEIFLQNNKLEAEVQNTAIRKIGESLRTAPQAKLRVKKYKK